MFFSIKNYRAEGKIIAGCNSKKWVGDKSASNDHYIWSCSRREHLLLQRWTSSWTDESTLCVCVFVCPQLTVSSPSESLLMLAMHIQLSLKDYGVFFVVAVRSVCAMLIDVNLLWIEAISLAVNWRGWSAQDWQIVTYRSFVLVAEQQHARRCL